MKLIWRLFQLALTNTVGPVKECRTLAAAYEEFGIPKAKILTRVLFAQKVSLLLAKGLSFRQAAKKLGTKLSTAHRRYREGEAFQESFLFFRKEGWNDTCPPQHEQGGTDEVPTP